MSLCQLTNPLARTPLSHNILPTLSAANLHACMAFAICLAQYLWWASVGARALPTPLPGRSSPAASWAQPTREPCWWWLAMLACTICVTELGKAPRPKCVPWGNLGRHGWHPKPQGGVATDQHITCQLLLRDKYFFDFMAVRMIITEI